MTDQNDRARRIADAVLSPKPAGADEPRNASPAEQELIPLRTLMLGLADELRTRRSVAAITALEARDISGQFRSEDYSLHNNAGRHKTLRITFMFKNPGMIPLLTVHGLDDEGRAEIAPLMQDGRIPAHRMDQILDVLECFLTRFLAAPQASANRSERG
ncbi:hypothetical protein [Microvirga sp. VF16]|uniref:hypothetical protein n=1 Tax=Microvirga sp. VF16 TaxID=2807101 RepID=UPI00193E18C3|nr:hypothetical protein [Microvirga sp. VF16]QRM33188.1 hypothetical protein JO965_28330 [Microvirga sp. VF16]